MTALPFTPAPPVYPEGNLPELVTVQCACLTGVLDYAVTASGDLVPVVCGKCDGRGELEVCERCGEVPTVDTDECGCVATGVATCELCGDVAPLNSACICGPCHDRGVLDLELSRSHFESEEAEELAFGVAIGWITAEEAGL